MQVYLSRTRENSIEFEPENLAISVPPGSEEKTELIFTNYSTPTHVQLSVSDELRDYIQFSHEYPQVQREKVVTLTASLQAGTGMRTGQIFITTGYGANKASLAVTLKIRELKEPVSSAVPEQSVEYSAPEAQVEAIEEKVTLTTRKPLFTIPFKFPEINIAPILYRLIAPVAVLLLILFAVSKLFTTVPQSQQFYVAVGMAIVIFTLLAIGFTKL